MIRFIHLSDQINEGSNEFAFFDTTTDKFISGKSGDQAWDSIEDFKEDCPELAERCLSLIPTGIELISEEKQCKLTDEDYEMIDSRRERHLK